MSSQAPAREDLTNTPAEAITTDTNYSHLPTPPAPSLNRYCLVSVGATAPFTPLVSAAFDPAFLTALIEAGYTRLVVQAGSDAAQFRDIALRFAHPSLKIDCFDFVDELRAVMVLCRGDGGVSRDTGVGICHAGTGTVLDAMSLNIPLIVIPNPALQDNHQLELAEELQNQGYALHGSADTLPQSLKAHECQKHTSSAFNPANPVPIAPASERHEAPTIWDIAHTISEQDGRLGNVSGARALSTMGELEREDLERLVEG
ncbi:uncharacterized protein DNG_02410 [Cephalotrichum gorgonifer]|uniref:UDP-N-acetylglucosamine transferase subunit ALG13 n=1 Tax=Cephalotrichum gorgonifer TaxID=2041049 RepID=A0AAE8MUZ6_9PEZI|nr:uncharacterized protein DNG_02410 [Cephalotrichum gorgonifer]